MRNICIGVVRNKKGEITAYKVMRYSSNRSIRFSIEYIENTTEAIEKFRNNIGIIENIIINSEGHIVYFPQKNTLGDMINALDENIIYLLKNGKKVELMHYDNWEFNDKRKKAAWTSDNIKNEILRFTELVGWTYPDAVEFYSYHLKETLECYEDICVLLGLKNILWLMATNYERMAYTHIVLSSRKDDMTMNIDDYNNKFPMTRDNYMLLQEDCEMALGISAWAIGGLKNKKRVISYHENKMGIIDEIRFNTCKSTGNQWEEKLIRYTK